MRTIRSSRRRRGAVARGPSGKQARQRRRDEVVVVRAARESGLQKQLLRFPRRQLALVRRLVLAHQAGNQQPPHHAGKAPAAGVERVEDSAGREQPRHARGQFRQHRLGQVVEKENPEHHVEGRLAKAFERAFDEARVVDARPPGVLARLPYGGGRKSTPTSSPTAGASSSSVSPMPQPRLSTREAGPAPVSARMRRTMCARSARTAGRAKWLWAKPE